MDLPKIKRAFKKIPLIYPLAREIKIKFNSINFKSSDYWEKRYKKSGNSGAGSYGRLADFKAEIINEFIERKGVKTVIEFGCGDGNQLNLLKVPSYCGIDVSEGIISYCKKKFKDDKTKKFITVNEYSRQTAELSLSLDVIYHLVEDEIFTDYLKNLFNSSTRYVIIYSSNTEKGLLNSAHVRHRRFTSFIDSNLKSWKQIGYILNKFPFDPSDSENTSPADFYFFEKN